MLSPEELIQTIYLGDRTCKGISIQAWDERVEIQVDCISRVRALSGNWEYYSNEDIKNGKIVFCGVNYLRLEPPGPIPNDAIDHISIAARREDGRYEFEFAAEAVEANGKSTMVKVFIAASSIHLEDPANPGVIR